MMGCQIFAIAFLMAMKFIFLSKLRDKAILKYAAPLLALLLNDFTSAPNEEY